MPKYILQETPRGDDRRKENSKDLRQIVADTNSGITTRGSHSHKVWIADVCISYNHNMSENNSI